jgi:hypothetical protein
VVRIKVVEVESYKGRRQWLRLRLQTIADIFATHRPLIALGVMLTGAVLLLVGLIGVLVRKPPDTAEKEMLPPVADAVFDVTEIPEAEATLPSYGGSRVETGLIAGAGSERRRLSTSSAR